MSDSPSTLAALTQRFEERRSGAATLGAAIKFDLGDEGVIVLDASTAPSRVHNDAGFDAPCTLKVSAEDLNAIMDGELDATAAFMMGRLTVEGDMAIAMKLASVLRG
jgi:putative sterol carrier protein